jgi:hypothetical protein
MQWAVYLANVEENRNHYKILVANLKEIAKLEGIGLAGPMIILN